MLVEVDAVMQREMAGAEMCESGMYSPRLDRTTEISLPLSVNRDSLSKRAEAEARVLIGRFSASIVSLHLRYQRVEELKESPARCSTGLKLQSRPDGIPPPTIPANGRYV